MRFRKAAVALLLVILFSLSALGAAEGTSSFYFFLSRRTQNVLPVDSKIGQTADPSSSEELRILSTALSEEFSFEWTETYLEENTRTLILNNMTNAFTSLLPQKEMVFSKPFTNGDSSVSVTVRFPESNRVLSFVVFNGKIIAAVEK